MKQFVNGLQLRLYLDESDRHGTVPLYEWLVTQAMQSNLAGATVIRGLEGFGSHRAQGVAGQVRLSSSLPIVVEIVDQRESVKAYLQRVEPFIREGCAVLQEVSFKQYSAKA